MTGSARTRNLEIPRCANCASEVWSGACHRAAQGADPLGPSRNDGVNPGMTALTANGSAVRRGRWPSFMTEARGSRVRLGSRAITEHGISTFRGTCLLLYKNDCETCSPIAAKPSKLSTNSCEKHSHGHSHGSGRRRRGREAVQRAV
jgi:hypothetical protein